MSEVMTLDEAVAKVKERAQGWCMACQFNAEFAKQHRKPYRHTCHHELAAVREVALAVWSLVNLSMGDMDWVRAEIDRLLPDTRQKTAGGEEEASL